MQVSIDLIGHALLAFGLLAAAASLYRFAHPKSPLAKVPSDVSPIDGDDGKSLTRRILVIKKVEFYSLMLLVFVILGFLNLVEKVPSAQVGSFYEVSQYVLQAYGIFALMMIPLRIAAKRRIRKLQAAHGDATTLLVHHIANQSDLSPFWQNQAVKFIQNRLF